MIDLKPTIYSALKNDSELSTLISDRVFFMQVPTTVKIEDGPCITYYEQNNLPVYFADNHEQASELIFVVDVWSKGNTTAIAQEVDRIMKSLGFVRAVAIDLYEQDTGVHHKSMRFTASKAIN